MSDPNLQWSIQLPILTVSEANRAGEHWREKGNRHQAQHWEIRAAFRSENPKIELPCTVKLSRLAPRMLDSHDNLTMAFKFIVDEIANQLIPGLKTGKADSDPRIKWEYSQEKRSKYKGIIIEIFKG